MSGFEDHRRFTDISASDFWGITPNFSEIGLLVEPIGFQRNYGNIWRFIHNASKSGYLMIANSVEKGTAKIYRLVFFFWRGLPQVYMEFRRGLMIISNN
jgi:hypothetical protein